MAAVLFDWGKCLATTETGILIAVPPRATPTVSFSGQMRISDNYVADHTADPPSVSTQPYAASPHSNGGRVYMAGFGGALTQGRNYGSGRESGTGQTKFEMEL